MWLQSLTNDAIQSAWEKRSASSDYAPLRDAAVSRSEADWIIGMNGSRVAATFLRTNRNDREVIITRPSPNRNTWDVVDHEISVLSHNPSPFWELEADSTAEMQLDS